MVILLVFVIFCSVVIYVATIVPSFVLPTTCSVLDWCCYYLRYRYLPYSVWWIQPTDDTYLFFILFILWYVSIIYLAYSDYILHSFVKHSIYSLMIFWYDDIFCIDIVNIDTLMPFLETTVTIILMLLGMNIIHVLPFFWWWPDTIIILFWWYISYLFIWLSDTILFCIHYDRDDTSMTYQMIPLTLIHYRWYLRLQLIRYWLWWYCTIWWYLTLRWYDWNIWCCNYVFYVIY